MEKKAQSKNREKKHWALEERKRDEKYLGVKESTAERKKEQDELFIIITF
jgi:hypothetical protein